MYQHNDYDIFFHGNTFAMQANYEVIMQCE